MQTVKNIRKRQIVIRFVSKNRQSQVYSLKISYASFLRSDRSGGFVFVTKILFVLFSKDFLRYHANGSPLGYINIC